MLNNNPNPNRITTLQAIKNGFNNYAKLDGQSSSIEIKRWNIFWITLLSAIWFVAIYSFGMAIFYDELAQNSHITYSEMNSDIISKYDMMFKSFGLIWLLSVFVITTPTITLSYRRSHNILSIIGVILIYIGVHFAVCILAFFLFILIAT